MTPEKYVTIQFIGTHNCIKEEAMNNVAALKDGGSAG